MSMRQLKISKSITNRESQSLEKYLQEIGKVELITPEEEVRLATLIKQGDQLALDRLTKANLRFVVSVAKQYQNQGLSLPDLINEGNLGLIKAAQRFDETRGFKFISYAVWWIRQSILQSLAEQSRIVRLPLNKVGLTNRIQKAYSLLEQQFEREPSAEELADAPLMRFGAPCKWSRASSRDDSILRCCSFGRTNISSVSRRIARCYDSRRSTRWRGTESGSCWPTSRNSMMRATPFRAPWSRVPATRRRTTT